MQTLLIYLHKIYKLCLSPLLGNCCRFYPSCSDYFLEAVRCHGSLKGLVLTFKRIIKCNPWHSGGNDPVPEKFFLFGKKK